MEKYDVVVIGAGTAGCLAAKTLAEKGLKTCLVENKSKEAIGTKICGDALGEHHLKTLGLEKPTSGELETRIEGIRIFSPDEETVFTIAHEDFIGYLLNRHLFGQWLLKKAIDQGVTLMDSTLFLNPIIQNDFVSGVRVKSIDGSRKKIQSKVVVDSSGFLGVVRRRLPERMNIEKVIENEDVEACYREIRQLENKTENTKYCDIYLNQEATPGGYTWIFPKPDAKVNVGLGVCMTKNFPNPKNQFYKYIMKKPIFNNSSILTSGSWFDPTRRPLDNMVGDGIVVTGDAASLVNPIHGGGIGPSMLSGFYAGRVISEALEKGKPTQEALWSYNNLYMESYGKKQASLDVFRLFLIKSSDADLNYGMSCKLLTEDDVLKAGMGDEFHLNITETARRVFRGIKRMRFLNKLRVTVNIMRQVQSHYNSYPTNPDEFEDWRLEIINIMKNARSKLIGLEN